MTNTNKLTNKQIAFGETDLEIEILYLAGKLPYIPAKNTYDIPRPANFVFRKIDDNTKFETFLMNNYELEDFVVELENLIALNGLDNIHTRYNNDVIITNGDLLQMIVDEICFRVNHYNYNDSLNKQ